MPEQVVEMLEIAFEIRFEQRFAERLFRAEVMVERALRDARRSENLVQTDGRKPLVEHDRLRDIQDVLANFRA